MAWEQRLSETKHSEMQSFARVLSHDMSALIRSARQLSAYAREDVLREDADAAMHAIGMLDVRLANLDRLVAELIRFHRAGQRPLQWETFSISNVLQAEYGKLSAPASARLVLNVAHDSIVGDLTLTRTVLRELLGNALVHHDAPHSMVISVDVARTRDAGILLHMQDNGPGLPAGTADRVLEPFIKLSGKAGAAGLGLSICKRELEAASGRISIRPHSDGFCVAVTLPPAPQDAVSGDELADQIGTTARASHLKLV